MKRLLRVLGIIAIVALIGFSMVACDNGTTGGLGYSSGSLSGTYYYDYDWYITFNSNGSFYGRSYTTTTGTYTISGSTLRLSNRFFGYNWTIVNSNTLRDGDGDYWRK